MRDTDRRTDGRTDGCSGVWSEGRTCFLFRVLTISYVQVMNERYKRTSEQRNERTKERMKGIWKGRNTEL